MKKALLIIAFIFSALFSAYSQTEKGTTYVGISGLPVLDVFKLFPDNKISGYGAIANFSFFPLKNISLGFNPYSAHISNSYPMYPNTTKEYSKKEEITLMGLNFSVRYHFTKGKFSFYPFVSVGGGQMGTTYYGASNTRLNSRAKGVFSLMAGAGVNYHICKKVALELNLPYTYLYVLPDMESQELQFHTATPTLGIQVILE
jgi:outer membrane protein W